MIRRPPRSTRVRSSAASDVYKRQLYSHGHLPLMKATGTGSAPGLDLAPIRRIPAKVIVVLVVNLLYAFFAEVAVLPPPRTLRRAWALLIILTRHSILLEAILSTRPG